jgi:hypothetical protein
MYLFRLRWMTRLEVVFRGSFGIVLYQRVLSGWSVWVVHICNRGVLQICWLLRLLEVVWVQGVVGIAKTVLLLWYEGSGLGYWHSPSSIARGKQLPNL